jgi:hypothetical protein
MFEAILNDQDLFSLYRAACEENDVCIKFSEILPEDKFKHNQTVEKKNEI